MKNYLSRILGERLLKVSDVYRGTGISKTTLTEIYYQRALNVQLDTLQKICDYLQIPLSELIEYVPTKKEKANDQFEHK
ncbi:helix-turn-helix domain-containing protein [Enterococcus sp. LJL120]